MKFTDKQLVQLPSNDDLVITTFTHPITFNEGGIRKHKMYADRYQTKTDIARIRYYKDGGNVVIDLTPKDIIEIAKVISTIDIMDEMWDEKQLAKFIEQYPFQ